MNINFTARHFRAPDDLRHYAEDGVARFEKYFDRINQCEFVILHENCMFMTKVNLHIPQHDVYAKSCSPNGLKSIVGHIDNISSQIVKIVDQWKKYP